MIEYVYDINIALDVKYNNYEFYEKVFEEGKKKITSEGGMPIEICPSIYDKSVTSLTRYQSIDPENIIGYVEKMPEFGMISVALNKEYLPALKEYDIRAIPRAIVAKYGDIERLITFDLFNYGRIPDGVLYDISSKRYMNNDGFITIPISTDGSFTNNFGTYVINNRTCKDNIFLIDRNDTLFKSEAIDDILFNGAISGSRIERITPDYKIGYVRIPMSLYDIIKKYNLYDYDSLRLGIESHIQYNLIVLYDNTDNEYFISKIKEGYSSDESNSRTDTGIPLFPEVPDLERDDAASILWVEG